MIRLCQANLSASPCWWFVPYLVVTCLRSSPPGIVFSFSFLMVQWTCDTAKTTRIHLGFYCCFFFQSCLMSWGICLKVSKKNFCTVYAWVSCIYSFFSLLTIQTTIHDALTHNELEYKRLELHWAGESWTLPVIQCYIRNAYPSFWLCRREQSCRRTWRRCWTYPTPARRSCKPVTGKQNRHELYTCFTKQAGYGKDQRDHYNRVTNSYPCSIKGALLARKTLFPIFFWILTTPL